MSTKKHSKVARKEVEEPSRIIPRERIRLKSAKQICNYISSCIRRAEQAGGGDADNVFYKRVMMASMLIKALEVSDIEERIKKLEEVMNGNG